MGIFVRSGVVNTGGGFLKYVYVGDYMSSAGDGGEGNYRLDFNVANVTPSNGPTHRSVGFSLRCLQE